VVLDQNAMPDYYQAMCLGDMKVSRAGDLLAFTLLDPTRPEQQVLWTTCDDLVQHIVLELRALVTLGPRLRPR
jgi:hypothetical protein